MTDTNNLSVPSSPLAKSELNKRLLYAALNGQSDSIKAVLAEGADINTKSSTGYTPLILAARHGHTDCVVALLSAENILVNEVTERGETALLQLGMATMK